MNKRLLLSLFLLVSAPVLAEEAQQEPTEATRSAEAVETQGADGDTRKKEITDETPAAPVVEAPADDEKK